MSLKPREQRTLAEIESQLRRSDPELVVMFTRLARGDRRWASIMGRHPLRPRQGSRARTVILITLGAVLLIACVAMAVATAGHAVPRRGGYPSSAGSRAGAHSAAYVPGANLSAGG